MTKTLFALAALCAPAFAQTSGVVTAQAFPDVVYAQEYSQTVSKQMSGAIRTQMMAANPITGKPFTATQEQHSLQILGDGTRIERTESSQMARDSQGRTRTEAAHPAGENPIFVTIQDPTEGTNSILNLDAKTADQLPAPRAVRHSIPATPIVGANGLPLPVTLEARIPDGPVVAKGGAFFAGAPAGPLQVVISQSKIGGAKPQIEDLGTETINGVVAKGTRTTSSIPAGDIGNDRPIQIVNERWYSDDLQMVVKSSNSDPRFGTTEFNLTGINRAEPDPTLFQIPAEYKVNSPK